MSDKTKNPETTEPTPAETEKEMHAKMTEHAVHLVDEAWNRIADELTPEMDEWLKKLAETNPDAMKHGTADIRMNTEGAVLIAMLALTHAVMRKMQPERALMYAVSAHALSQRIVSKRDESAAEPTSFPQSGIGRA